MTVSTEPQPQASPRRAMAEARRRGSRWFPLLLVLTGIIVLLYPVVATQYNNVKQREFSQQYNNEVLSSAPEDLSVDLARAREYNAKLEGIPILDPWLLKVAADPGSIPYQEYASQLNRFDVMARIRVPDVGIDLPVYHGTTDDVIAKGAGHLYGTALPAGGEGTHSVLTSHSGMPNATLFDHLPEVKEGQLMLVDVSGETIAYRVDQIKTVLPNEIGDLVGEPGHDYLTLFTCTPYAVNTHRLLVRGERVPYTPEVEEAAKISMTGSAFRIEPWMWWLLGGASVGVSAVVVIIVRERKRNRAVPEHAAN